MRLSVVLGFVACFLLPVQSQAAWDIFQSYVILDSGSGDQYLAGGINADGASAFAGSDLGDFTAADALTLNGGELKTYKNGSSNVCGGTLNYRVYASGDTPGAFTSLALPFSANLSGSDQKWATTGQAIDLLDALTAGDYVLELYWEADGNDSNPSGCGETQYDSDSGNNFTATFSVIQSSSCVSPTYQGYTYDVIQIGDQCWFAENLKATSFNNGDLIPLQETNGQWNGNTTPIRRRPGNSDANFDLYGYHYSGWTMTDARNVCPVGWHVPTKNDWMILMVEAGAPAEDTLNLSHLQTIGAQELTGQKLRGTSAGGTDDFGFNALMGGRSHGAGQGTKDLHVKGTWFFDMQDPNSSNVGGGEYFRIEMTTSTNHVQIARNRRKYGTTLRCMLDAPTVAAAIPGCMDSNYTEYDADATTDDGSCATPVVEGCTDPNYLEFDSSANEDDGSCATLIVEGCTNPAYTEYNAAANTDDGSCSTLVVEGCTDSNYTEYDASANTDDGSCSTLVVEGCTNANYVEYDASANTDDGSCATLVVEGCTDSNYIEYDASANTDDGSCETQIVQGCTDPEYTEYNPAANSDDGSCQTPSDPCIIAIAPSFALDFGQPDMVLSTGDDDYSNVALPFPFDFSGTSYESVTIASNGVLGLGSSSTSDPYPQALADYQTDVILGAHHDLNPSASASSLISYGIHGMAPNRAFVASWRGIPSYDDNSLLHDFQIVLYEAGNVIEIWNGGHPYIAFGYITIGIAREDGTGIGPSNYNDEALAAGKWSFTPDGSGGHIQAQSSNSALSLESIVPETPATTVDGTDGQATLLVNSGDPTSLTLTGINGAGDYSFAQPGSLDGIAPGLYSVTASDANGCTSNALTLIMTYALCCDCGVSDADSDGLCDDEDNCTDKTATNYADPANEACTY